MEKPKIGDKFYRVADDSRDEIYNKTITVVKVGHKYFYCDDCIKYNIKDRRSNEGDQWSSEHTLYDNEQAYNDKLDADKIAYKISNQMRHDHNFSLKQLQEVDQILNQN